MFQRTHLQTSFAQQISRFWFNMHGTEENKKNTAKKAKDLAGKQQSRSVQHGSEPQWAVCAEALIKLGSHKSCCTAPQPLRSASERLSAVGLSNRVSKASTF